MRYVIVYSLIAFLTACSGLEPFAEKNVKPIDIEPPMALSIISIGEDCIQINTNENAFLKDVMINDQDPLKIEETENGFLLTTCDKMVMGAEYVISGMLEDNAGNTSRFIESVYGLNPNPAVLAISEVVTQGSSRHPDFAELVVQESGNLAGICVYEGLAEGYNSKLIFPDCEVVKGDFILLHWKPQGIAEEIDETIDKTASGGIDACDTAWDFWVKGATGLSANNGILSVYNSPNGSTQDLIIYSNRTSISDTNYQGFGSDKMLEWAQAAGESGLWPFSGDVITPEDCVNPDDSTATRSICRVFDETLNCTNGKSQWYITVTSGASRGIPNTLDRYIPK